jgi:hypothetical protein
MRPAFLEPGRFEAVVTDREERSFLLPRTEYLIRWDDGFCLRDSAGDYWRPCEKEYRCDLASVPHPLTLLPCFIPTRYQRAAAIHDYACRHGKLATFSPVLAGWKCIEITRATADRIFADGLEAERAWTATRWAYYAGVRLGSVITRKRKP